jgi:hypothetical protein
VQLVLLVRQVGGGIARLEASSDQVVNELSNHRGYWIGEAVLGWYCGRWTVDEVMSL